MADITKRGSNYTLSLLARPQFNTFFAEVERLPGRSCRSIGGGWARRRSFTRARPVLANTTMYPGNTNDEARPATNFVGNAVRADTYHQIVAPQMMGGWLSVIPRAGAR